MVVAVVMGGTLEPGGLLNDPFKPLLSFCDSFARVCAFLGVRFPWCALSLCALSLLSVRFRFVPFKLKTDLIRIQVACGRLADRISFVG